MAGLESLRHCQARAGHGLVQEQLAGAEVDDADAIAGHVGHGFPNDFKRPLDGLV